MKSYDASFINEEFKIHKIKRAYEGLSYIRVSNSGKAFAYLWNKKYFFETAKGRYSGKRSLEAATNIFMGLISVHQNFECDGAYYYVNVNEGKWKWIEKSSENPFKKK
ncbi:hypothetical protein [Aquimarina spongiae]|uniref:Uncharacterized protein n=1 Tax=Aquimarina spongiae TaxID=570521 RepID=A0A1M6JEU1_9FLAO|nr:hypothetical protein [Aquimarina spongiae]SHJ45190.1 hypothetical protein SAMN04488508_10929 [Aquimarina spongiae]